MNSSHASIKVGTIRDQIEQLIQHLVEVFDDSLLSAGIPALIEAAEHHPEVAEFLHARSAQRRQSLIDTIQRGVDTGQLSPHLDPAPPSPSAHQSSTNEP